jgi:cyclic pyranopterin phosphate synthase
MGRPRMVDVSEKPATARRAVAEALVVMDQETLTLIIDGHATKGDVLVVAELAGIMGAKRTAELIPLCHPIALTDVGVEITPDRKASALRITAHAATTGPTGVEMEALTAASIAALTAYDMLKSADRGISIEGLRLIEKRGGKSGVWQRPADREGSRPASARPVRRSRPSGRGT